MTFRPATLVDKWGVPFFQGEIDDGGGGDGSQTISVVRLPLAFDTAGLVADDGGASTGIVVYTPTVGEVILASLSYMSVTTAWNGTVPTINWTLTDYDGALASGDLAFADGNWPSGWEDIVRYPQLNDQGTGGGPLFGWSATLTVVGSLPIRAVVDDGSGGDPGSSQGAGELVIVSMAAA